MDLHKLRQSMHRLYRHAHHLHDFPEDPIHAEAWAACNKYSAALDKARQKHWMDWLKNVSEPDIWSAHQYIAKPAVNGGLSTIPTLCQETSDGSLVLATTNEEKSK